MQNNFDFPAVATAAASASIAVAQAIGHASTTAAQIVAPALEHAVYAAIHLVVEGGELVMSLPFEEAKLYCMKMFTSTYPVFVEKIPAILLGAMCSRVIQIHSKANKPQSSKPSTLGTFASEKSLTPEKLQTTDADHVKPTAKQAASSQNLEIAETPSLLTEPSQAPMLISKLTHTTPTLKINNSEEQEPVHGDTKRKRFVDEDPEFDESPSKKKINVEKVSTDEFELHDDVKSNFEDDREIVPTQQVEVEHDVTKNRGGEVKESQEESQERPTLPAAEAEEESIPPRAGEPSAWYPNATQGSIKNHQHMLTNKEVPTSSAAEVEEESTSPRAAEPSAWCPDATQESIENHRHTLTKTRGQDVIEIDSSDEDE
jgi:hypothetical protein